MSSPCFSATGSGRRSTAKRISATGTARNDCARLWTAGVLRRLLTKTIYKGCRHPPFEDKCTMNMPMPWLAIVSSERFDKVGRSLRHGR